MDVCSEESAEYLFFWVLLVQLVCAAAPIFLAWTVLIKRISRFDITKCGMKVAGVCFGAWMICLLLFLALFAVLGLYCAIVKMVNNGYGVYVVAGCITVVVIILFHVLLWYCFGDHRDEKSETIKK